jgi:hypothetical protein
MLMKSKFRHVCSSCSSHSDPSICLRKFVEISSKIASKTQRMAYELEILESQEEWFVVLSHFEYLSPKLLQEFELEFDRIVNKRWFRFVFHKRRRRSLSSLASDVKSAWKSTFKVKRIRDLLKTFWKMFEDHIASLPFKMECLCSRNLWLLLS